MSCTCDSSGSTVPPAGAGCCSIHDHSNGIAVRFVLHSAVGAPSGIKITAAVADGSSADLLPSASQRFVVYMLQAVKQDAGVLHVFRGTSVGDSSDATKALLRGHVSDFGGIAINYPLVRLAAGESLYVQTTSDASSPGNLDVVGFGVLETIPT